MKKRVGLLAILIFTFTLFLVACGKPYENMKLTLSGFDTEVVLYLKDNVNEAEDGEELEDESGEIGDGQESDAEEFLSEKTITATISGAKKGVSGEVTVTQTGAYVVDVKNQVLDGTTTTFDLVAKNPGSATIVIRSREGNLSKTFRVIVHRAVSDIQFKQDKLAMSEDGQMNLRDQLVYSPVGTSQTDVGFYFVDERSEVEVLNIDEEGRIFETEYARIVDHALIIKNKALAPYDESEFNNYVTVVAYSKVNNEVVSEPKKINIISLVNLNDISLFVYEGEDVVEVKSNLGVYEIVLGSNQNDARLFKRNMFFEIGDYLTEDLKYNVSFVVPTGGSAGIVQILNRTRYEIRKGGGGTERINFEINQIKNGEVVVPFTIEYEGYKGLFNHTLNIKFIVKSFPNSIRVEDGSGNILQNNSSIDVYRNYANNLMGTYLKVSALPGDNLVRYSLRVSGVDPNNLRVRSITGEDISLLQNSLVNGQGFYLSHNLNSDMPQDAKVIITVTYSLAPTQDNTGYISHQLSFELKLNYKIGLQGLDTPANLLIDSNLGHMVNDDGTYDSNIVLASTSFTEIEFVSDESLNTGSHTEVVKVAFTTFNGVPVQVINDFNLDPLNNEFFSLDFVDNNILLVPHRSGKSVKFALQLVTSNGIVRDVALNMFTPLTYSNNKFLNVEVPKVSNSAFETLWNGYHTRASVSGDMEYFLVYDYIIDDGTYERAGERLLVRYDEAGDVASVYDENSQLVYLNENAGTQLPVIYESIKEVNLKTNASINLEFFNYLPYEDSNGFTFERVSYNTGVFVVNAPMQYFSYEKNASTGGVVLTAKGVATSQPIPIKINFIGYNVLGEEVSLQYEFNVIITRPVANIFITPSYSEIYEITSVGQMASSKAEVALNVPQVQGMVGRNLTLQYDLVNEQVYNYTFQVDTSVNLSVGGNSYAIVDYIKNYINQSGNNYISISDSGWVTISFMSGDAAQLQINKLQARLQQSFYDKIKHIYKLERYIPLGLVLTNDPSVPNGVGFSENEMRILESAIIERFYSSSIVVRVTAKVSHYSELPLYAIASVKLNFARKVSNVIADFSVEEGLYFDTRLNSKKQVSFFAYPTNADNRNLVAYIKNPAVARIVSGVDANGVITGLDADGVYTGKVVIERLKAGLTSLVVTPQDSYYYGNVNGEQVLLSQIYEYQIRVSDGSKLYPFEIRTATELNNIRNHALTYHYVLAKNINLANFNWQPIANFAGGLSGAYTYYQDNMYHTRYHSISGLSLNADISIDNNDEQNYSEINIGMFENLMPTAEIKDINFVNAKVNVTANKLVGQNNTEFNKNLNVGVLAGKSAGLTLNVIANGEVLVTTNVNQANVGGLIGLQNSRFNSVQKNIVGQIGYNKVEDNVISESAVSVAVKLISEKDLVNQTNKNVGGVVGALVVSSVNNETDFTKISNLYKAQALFGVNANSVVESLYKNGVQYSVNGANIGGVAGFVQNAVVNKVVATPHVRGAGNVGGLIGLANKVWLEMSEVLLFANNQTGINSASIVGAGNVGGLVGSSNGITVLNSYLRDFTGKAISENYYGNILLISAEQEPTSVSNVGGLVGLVKNGGSATNVYYMGTDINTLPIYVEATEEPADSLGVWSAPEALSEIYQSYFNGSINASDQNVLGTVNVGALAGYVQERSQQEIDESNYAALSIEKSYAIAEVKGATTESVLVDLIDLVNNNPQLLQQQWADVGVDGAINSIAFGEHINLEIVNNKLVKTITTVSNELVQKLDTNNQPELDEFNNPIYQVEITKRVVVEDMFGMFTSNEAFAISKTLKSQLTSYSVTIFENDNVIGIEVVQLGHVPTIADFALNYPSATTVEFVVIEEHLYDEYAFSATINNDILLNENYVLANVGLDTERFGVVENAGQLTENVTINFATLSYLNTRLQGQNLDQDVHLQNIKTSLNSYDLSEKLFSSKLASAFGQGGYNFEMGYFEVALFDESNNLLVSQLVTYETPTLQNYLVDYPTATRMQSVFISLLNNNRATWFAYAGINQNLPLIITLQGELLYKVMPSSVTAIIATQDKLTDLLVTHKNLGFIKIDENSLVLFRNNVVGNPLGSAPNYLNKYRIVRKGAQITEGVFNLIEVELNVTLDVNSPYQPHVIDELEIISLNSNIVRVLSGGIIEVLSTGNAELLVRLKNNPSINTTINILVVKGLSDFKLISSAPTFNTIYIDAVSNFTLQTYNSLSVPGFMSEFEKNENIGYIVSVNYDGGARLELNNELLLGGEQYVYETLREFKLKGVHVGNVQLNITPFIKINNAQFGSTIVGVNASVQNAIILHNYAKVNMHSFVVRPQATDIHTNNKTSARISPVDNTSVTVTFITSDFNQTVFEGMAGNENERIVDLQTYNNVVNEDIITIINSANGNVLSIQNILEQANESQDSQIIRNTLLVVVLNNISAKPVKNAQGAILQLEVSFELGIRFNREKFKTDNSGQAYNLNMQDYNFTFIPNSNQNLQAKYNLSVIPNEVNRITTAFYAGGEYDVGGLSRFNPSETPSNFIAPGRIGLMKIFMFPEFNNAEFVEITVSQRFRDLISFDQMIEVYGGEQNSLIGYQKTGYAPYLLPGNEGIRLRNLSIINAGSQLEYNGSLFTRVALSGNAPADEDIVFNVSAYKTQNGQPVLVKSDQVVLQVQPLPSVSLTYKGLSEGVATAGTVIELDLVVNNFIGEVDLDIYVDGQSSNDTVSLVEYNRQTGKVKIALSDDILMGDKVIVSAKAKGSIDAPWETDPSIAYIDIVDFIVNNVSLLGASSIIVNENSFEILNGTSNELSVVLDAQYSTITMNGQLRQVKEYLERVIAGKEKTENGHYVNNWKIFDDGTYVNAEENKNYNEIFFFQRVNVEDFNPRNFLAINGLKVDNGTFKLGIEFRYFYDHNGRLQIYTGNEVAQDIKISNMYEFRLIIHENSTYDHPNPVGDETAFYNMQPDVHYILTNDIVLTNHKPFNANFASLDGNGFVVHLQSFDMSQYRVQNANSVVTGLWEVVSPGTIIKNITVNVAGLLVDNSVVQELKKPNSPYENTSKILLTNISDVVFGVIAGENNGTITNAKVVNLTNSGTNIVNKQLFVNTTQHFINGQELVAKIGGVVGINNGTISNSYIGQNYYSIVNGAKVEDNQHIEGASYIKRAVGSDTTQQETYNFAVSGGKQIAGFVYQNNGTIANSYSKEVGVINQSTIANNTQTAGFVLDNANTIYNSFVEGANVTNYRADSSVYLEGKGFIGGFVYSNRGTITDAYSNVTITSNSGRSGGFVYTNLATGTIKNAYASGNSGARNTSGTSGHMSAHGLFTGINDTSEYNNNGTMRSVYYLLMEGEMKNSREPALPIPTTILMSDKAVNPFREESSFGEFSFATTKELENGNWIMNSGNLANQKYGPQLLSSVKADTFSFRLLDKTEPNPAKPDSVIHYYKYHDSTPYASESNPILVNTADEFLTAVLDLTNVYTHGNNIMYVFGEGANSHIRLVNNLNFEQSNLNERTVTKLSRYTIKISDVVFAGVLDGNGMTMSGMTLLDLNATQVNENYGFFKQVGLTNAQYTNFIKKPASNKINSAKSTIKNLTFSIGRFDATNSIKVGAIAGSIYDSNLINLTVRSSGNVVVQGRNLVGAVAGLIQYESSNYIISGLNVQNISVAASHSTRQILSSDTIDKFGEVASGLEKVKYNSYREMTSSANLQNYSYAGGVAGVFVGVNRSLSNQNIKQSITEETDQQSINEDINSHRSEETAIYNNITNSQGGRISAENAGGLFGFVSKDSHIMYSGYYISANSNSQEIYGYNYAGGLVAENYGMLEKVYVQHDRESQEQFDANAAQGTGNSSVVGKTDLFGTRPNVAIGGIAGFTDNSIIIDSFVKANIVNKEAKIAGGIVGVATRKNFVGHTFVYGNVQARTVYGGAFGLYNASGEKLITTGAAANNKLLLDYVIALNTWSPEVEAEVSTNMRSIYARINDIGYYNFNLVFPEVGNMLPTFEDKDTVNFGTGLTNDQISALQTEYVNRTNSVISQDITFKYIGSLVGRVSMSNPGEADAKMVSGGRIEMITDKGLEKVLPTSRETNVRGSDKTVASTMFTGARKMPHYRQDISGDWPNNLSSQLVGDVINYNYSVGNQSTFRNIVGAQGATEPKKFLQWLMDSTIVSENQSQTWMMLDNATFPTYRSGIYSNYIVIDTNAALNSLITNINTKNQYYVLRKNKDSADGSYEISAGTINNNANIFQNEFAGVLIGERYADEEGQETHNPLIKVAVTRQTSARISSVFRRLNTATISNIDFEISFNTTADVPVTLYNNVEDESSEINSKNFGLLVRDTINSVITNVSVNVKHAAATDLNLQGATGISNFGILFGGINNSVISNVQANINNNINYSATVIQYVGGFAAELAGSDILSSNIYGNNKFINISTHGQTSTVENMAVSGFVGKATTQNRTPLIRDANTSVIVFNNEGETPSVVNNTGVQVNVKGVHATLKNLYVGGLVGLAESVNIQDSFVFGQINVGSENSISATTYVGGVVGRVVNTASLENIYVNSYKQAVPETTNVAYAINKNSENKKFSINVNITKDAYVGGFVGLGNSTGIKSGLFNKDLSVSSNNSSDIVVNYNATTSNQTLSVGGLAGELMGTRSNPMINVFNAGDITINRLGIHSRIYVGGLVGHASSATITSVYNYGNILFETNNNFAAGGIAGILSGNLVTIENYMALGDITLKHSGTTLDNNKVMGGVFGKHHTAESTVTVRNGFSATRFFTIQNDVKKVHAADAFTNPIGVLAKITSGNSKLVWVYEFYPEHKDVGSPISYRNLNKLNEITQFKDILGGVGEVTFTAGKKLGDGFLYNSNSSSYIKLPYLSELTPYSQVQSELPNLFAAEGKLNPKLIKLNTDIVNNMNGYYIVDSKKITPSMSEDRTFNGFITGSYYVESNTDYYSEFVHVATISSIYKPLFAENNGIIANFVVNKNSVASVVSKNNGIIHNVTTYGATTSNIVGKEFGLISDTNTGQILNSGAIALFNGSISASSKIAGIALLNSGLINNSYANFVVPNNQQKATISGLVSENSGNVKNSYFGGMFDNNSESSSTNSFVTDSSKVLIGKSSGGRSSNIVYDSNNMLLISNNKVVLPSVNLSAEDLNSKWLNMASSGSNEQFTKAFASNSSIAFNFGYPTIKGGAVVPTNARIAYNTAKFEDNYLNVYSQNISYFTRSTNPVNSIFVLAYSPSSFMRAKDSNILLVSNINFKGYREGDLPHGQTIGFGNLGANKVVLGNNKTISNLTIKGNGLFNVMNAGSAVGHLTLQNIVVHATSLSNPTGTLASRSYGSLNNIKLINRVVMGRVSVGGLVGEIQRQETKYDSSIIFINNIEVLATSDISYAGVYGTSNEIGGVFGRVYGTREYTGTRLSNITVSGLNIVASNPLYFVGGAIGIVFESDLGTIEGTDLNVNSASVTVPANVNASGVSQTYQPNANVDSVGGLIGTGYVHVLQNTSLKVNSTSVSGKDRVGGVIGFAEIGTSSARANMHADNQTIVKGNSGVGGLVGRLSGSNVYEANSYATVEGVTTVGGAFGYTGNSTFGSINVGDVATGAVDIEGYNYIGGAIGTSSNSVINIGINVFVNITSTMTQSDYINNKHDKDDGQKTIYLGVRNNEDDFGDMGAGQPAYFGLLSRYNHFIRYYRNDARQKLVVGKNAEMVNIGFIAGSTKAGLTITAHSQALIVEEQSKISNIFDISVTLEYLYISGVVLHNRSTIPQKMHFTKTRNIDKYDITYTGGADDLFFGLGKINTSGVGYEVDVQTSVLPGGSSAYHFTYEIQDPNKSLSQSELNEIRFNS